VDTTLESGDSYSFDANATDLSGIKQWWINNTNFNIDADGIITNVSTLNVGIYWIRINVSDNYDNNLTKVFKITVEDTTAPIWVNEPVDTILELGDSYSFDANATDPSGIKQWWINNTNFNVNANGLINNTSSLIVGVYWIRINVSDNYDNNLTKVFKITVEDTTAPIWVDEPVDTILELGDSYSFDANATDPSGIKQWWINNTNFNVNANGLINNTSSLIVGVYWIRINVSDNYDNNLTKVFKITVEDTTAPIWVDEPVDITLELGDSYSFDANATDPSGIKQWWINHTNFNIDADGIITNVSTLNVGIYWIRINVSDNYDNNLTKVFKITVEDTTAPTWVDEPVDTTLELGDSYSFDANATDPSGIKQWWINHTNFNIDADGIITNVSTLNVGIYWIRINVSDNYDNNLTKVFKITIIFEDTAAPTWVDEPVDTNLELGDSYSFDANATDPSGVKQWWINNTNFNVNANGLITNTSSLIVGVYWIRINVSDNYDNNLTKVFKITVEDTTAPTWVDEPVDTTLELGDSYSFDANATDPSGIKQWWINNTNFNVNANGLITNTSNLNVGVYWIRINVSDNYDNNLTKVFKITVGDTTAPIWVDEPFETTLELGDSYSFDANATDLSGIKQWWINHTNFNVNANGLITNVSTLNVGVYWIRINVSDNYDNNLTKVFKITVEDTTAPIWVNEPVDTTLELGDSYSFDANATDPSGIKQWWINNTNFNVNANGLITNTSNLNVGVYWIKINVSDNYDNNLTKVFKITVEITIKPPNVKNIVPFDGSSFLNNVDIEINATITDDGTVLSAKVMINTPIPFNITMQLGSANNWTCIWDNVSLYDSGNYRITIWAKDNDGLINQTEFVIITINDVINPNVILEKDEDKGDLILDISILVYIIFASIGAGFVIGVFLAYREETKEDMPEIILKKKSLFFMYIPQKSIETKESALINFGKTFLKYIWLIIAIIIGIIFSIYFVIIPNKLSLLIAFLIVEIISISIFGAIFLKPEKLQKIKEKITTNWKFFTLLGCMILLAVIGILIWKLLVSFLGIKVIYHNYSILLLILIVEISSILIVLIQFLKPEWREVPTKKVLFNWKSFALFGGLVFLTIIGIIGWGQLSGIVFPPISYSVLIPILIAEIMSILIVGAKLLKFEWHEVKTEKISINWKIISLNGSLILLAIIGIFGWMQLSGRTITLSAFSFLITILIAEIASILIVGVKILKFRERSDKISAKWKCYILMICIILFAIIGALLWFLLRI
ncbi:MAG: Ig-like domain-containing protein, partial [Candidatus Hodarchaeota archaeon]